VYIATKLLRRDGELVLGETWLQEPKMTPKAVFDMFEEHFDPMDFDNPMFLDFLSIKQMIVNKANSGELGPEYISRTWEYGNCWPPLQAFDSNHGSLRAPGQAKRP
jgi:hypothetical protein